MSTTQPQQQQFYDQTLDHGTVQPPPLPGLQLVQTENTTLDLVFIYEQLLGTEALHELKELVKPLKNIKVCHINATAYGGGVAELFHRQIPLMNQLGREVNFVTDWLVLNVSNPAFYDVTKKMHNTLQGAEGHLSKDERDLYRRITEENFSNGRLNDYDVVFIHDPQPAGLIDLYHDRRNKWAWRCHIDTSTPNEEVWAFTRAYAEQYDTVIFTRESFVKDKDSFKQLNIVPPSIDPLSPKNSTLGFDDVKSTFKRYGVDMNRPVMVQVSRFDPWKQPLEVIQAYQDLKKEFKDLQLVLAGSMATDDPEGLLYWERTLRKAGQDPDVVILNNYHGVGNKEINAFQTGADVLVQYSSKEGFGLTVSEGMWKEQPVIGGRVGGIQDQITHGETGYLVSTLDELKDAARDLLANPAKKKEMGAKAKQRVADHFLITREVGDYLKIIHQLKGFELASKADSKKEKTSSKK